MRIAAAVLALVVGAPPASAQSDIAVPMPKATAKPAKKRTPPPPKAASDASLPLAERLVIQFDLAWTGDFSGLIDGEPGDKTTAAIKAFQRSHKARETGVLDAQERALLAAASKAAQRLVG